MYGIVYVLLFGQVGVWFYKGELCQKRRTWASVIILVIEKCEKQVSSLCVTMCRHEEVLHNKKQEQQILNTGTI